MDNTELRDKLNKLEELSDKEIELYRSFNKEQLDYICNLAKTIENLDSDRENLIAFLEDKIKECDVIMQMSIDSLNDKFADKKDEENVRRTLKITIRECEIEIKAFQEVLDFVKGNEKND